MSDAPVPSDPDTDSTPVLSYAAPAASRRVNLPALIGFCFCVMALPVCAVLSRGAAALISGAIAAIGLILGLAALRAPPALIGEGRPRRGFPLIVVVMACAILVASIIPRSERRTHVDAADKCMENLGEIGLACMMYANSRPDGRFPDKLADLLGDGVTSDCFVCWRTNDTPATGPTTQAVMQQMAAPGHVSYVYVGKGLTNTAGSDAVLAYDDNHHDGHTRILYADGHVQCESRVMGKKIIAELKAGHNPPRWEMLK